MGVSLYRNRAGVSVVFDALLFFLIISFACATLFYSASRNSAQDELGPQNMGQQAADVMACALDATVGPVNYSAGGAGLAFTGTALECVCEALRVQSSCQQWNISGLENAVHNVFSLLVDRPYHFAVEAHVPGWRGGLLLTDAPGEPGGMSGVRWSCSVMLDVDGQEGEMALFLWR